MVQYPVLYLLHNWHYVWLKHILINQTHGYSTVPNPVWPKLVFIVNNATINMYMTINVVYNTSKCISICGCVACNTLDTYKWLCPLIWHCKSVSLLSHSILHTISFSLLWWYSQWNLMGEKDPCLLWGHKVKVKVTLAKTPNADSM